MPFHIGASIAIAPVAFSKNNTVVEAEVWPWSVTTLVLGDLGKGVLYPPLELGLSIVNGSRMDPVTGDVLVNQDFVE